MYSAGIDMGSRTVKVVFLEELKVDGAPQLKWGVKGKHIMFPEDLDADQAADKAFNEALQAGADIITVPPKFFPQMCVHPKTDEAVKQFIDAFSAWQKPAAAKAA